MKHKHAKLIIAWANGATIQYYSENLYHEWRDANRNQPIWEPGCEYRIKPEPKPDYFRLASGYHREVLDKVMLTFDGETGKLKGVSLVDKKVDE